MNSPLLILNTGSSSLKFSLFSGKNGIGRRLSKGEIRRIGLPETQFTWQTADGEVLARENLPQGSLEESLHFLLKQLKGDDTLAHPSAVAHRVVHGGPKFREPHPVDNAMLDSLREFAPYDPEHLPRQIQAIAICQQEFPATPQIACFDTYFHRHLPPVAQRLPLPRTFAKEGLIRYGFHGISYESILQQIQAESPEEAQGKVIIAHLGNGASMAALSRGQGIETTMGFSPSGGLVMSSRTGDLDPGALLFLNDHLGNDPKRLRAVINEESGLLGVSEITSDMQDLLEKEAESPQAGEAIALFCYQAKKHLASLTAVLGGLETLIFTAGIGEKAPVIRERICKDLSFLGISLSTTSNAANNDIISAPESRVMVRVMITDEEKVMARHAARIIQRSFV